MGWRVSYRDQDTVDSEVRHQLPGTRALRSFPMRIARQLTLIAGIMAAPISLGVSLAQPAKPTMKAIVVHEYGGPEVLKYQDAPRPAPKEDQILVRVSAAGVNPVDDASRSEKYAKFFGITLPFIPGYDIAGVVEKTGAKITKFKAGDQVYAYLELKDGGGYAEYAVATEVEAAAKPKSISFTEAAGVPVVALTAWQALIDKAKLSAGQTVLIHGGSGGVGSFAIQIAKARGAKVIATASTANQNLLKQLGADVAVDYTKQKFEDAAKDVDVVLDSVGKDTLARSYGVVKKGRSEEHTSELQSPDHLVCRLLLEKKNKKIRDRAMLRPSSLTAYRAAHEGGDSRHLSHRGGNPLSVAHEPQRRSRGRTLSPRICAH